MNSGGLITLRRFYDEKLNEKKNVLKMSEVVAKIVANMSACQSLHNDLIDSGRDVILLPTPCDILCGTGSFKDFEVGTETFLAVLSWGDFLYTGNKIFNFCPPRIVHS